MKIFKRKSKTHPMERKRMWRLNLNQEEEIKSQHRYLDKRLKMKNLAQEDSERLRELLRIINKIMELQEQVINLKPSKA